MPHKKAPVRWLVVGAGTHLDAQVSYGAIPTDDGAGEIELTNRVPDSEVLKKSQAELAAELKKQQMTESRMLTCFQIFLTIAFMVGYTMLFESMGWLKSIDVDALAQHPGELIACQYPTDLNGAIASPWLWGHRVRASMSIQRLISTLSMRVLCRRLIPIW